MRIALKYIQSQIHVPGPGWVAAAPIQDGDLRDLIFKKWIHDPLTFLNRGHVPDEIETPHVRFSI